MLEARRRANVAHPAATSRSGPPQLRPRPDQRGESALNTREPARATVGPVQPISRITQDPDVMGGRPCIRGLRVTVGTIVGLLAAGKTAEQVLEAYPYLEREDIQAALTYAAWRTEEVEVPLRPR